MKKNLGLIISSIGIICILIALCLLFVVDNGSNKGNKNDKENKEKIEPQEKREEIDLSNINTEILFYIPFVQNKKIENSKYVYQNKIVTIDDFNNEDLYSFVLYNLDYDKVDFCKADEGCFYKAGIDLVKERAEELFGTFNQTLPKETSANVNRRCTLNNDKYICTSLEDASYENNEYEDYFFSTTEYMDIKEITKAEKDSKYLYIYEKYINARLDLTDNYNKDDLNTINYYLYKTSNSDEKIVEEKILGKEYYEEPIEKSFGLKILEKYIDLAPTYVHKFKIENNTYKWVSTEPVK